jgi:ATP-dependent DNA ligase
MFAVVCKLGLDGIVSKKLSSGYKSGPSKAWLRSKIKVSGCNMGH